MMVSLLEMVVSSQKAGYDMVNIVTIFFINIITIVVINIIILVVLTHNCGQDHLKSKSHLHYQH